MTKSTGLQQFIPRTIPKIQDAKTKTENSNNCFSNSMMFSWILATLNIQKLLINPKCIYSFPATSKAFDFS